MLQVELRALDDGPVEVAGSVSAGDLGLEEADQVLVGPVQVAGRLSRAGAGQYFWRGRLQAAALLDCRRCLAEVKPALDVPVDVLFVEGEEPEDAGTYAITPETPVLNLAEMVREELLLAVPEWILCRDDCRGLCAGCGTDLNTGSCSCAPSVDPRWAALEALKPDLANEES